MSVQHDVRRPPRPVDARRRWALRTATVLLTSLALGALTSYAQGFLPDSLRPLANSASGWTILTASTVAAARPGLRLGALWGAGSFVLLVLGYTAASQWRGLGYDPTPWIVVGLVAGPVVGASAAALRGTRPMPAAVGSGLLAAVLLLDAGVGLTVLSATTSPVCWSLATALAVLLLAVTAHRVLLPADRARRLLAAQLGVVVAAVVLGGVGWALVDQMSAAL